MAFAPLTRTQRSAPATASRTTRAAPAPGLTGVVQRKCACGGGSGCGECARTREDIQTKLEVSEPGDTFEREADRIADRVMAAPADSGVTPSSVGVQRFARPSSEPREDTPASVGETLATPGQPMDTSLRHDMEQRFGHAFGDVRLHVDRRASESAADIGARAYTFGQHVVFGHGAFDRASGAGRRLLAHELAHTIQQRQGGHEPHSPLTASGPTVARQPDAEPKAERICVPGADPSSPACVESEQKRKQLERERRTPVAPFTGLAIPAHPNAVTGIHDWEGKYAAPGTATNQNSFDVGQFRMQQICTFDDTGAARVYVYYTYDTAGGGDKYAVGPDSLWMFVFTHGSTITARPGNRDALPSNPKDASAPKDTAEPPREEKRICVPGSNPDSPECKDWEWRKKQLEQERRTPVAPDAGLKVPVDPDAVKGIHDWSTEYATPTGADVKNRFDAGKYRLQQVVTFDESGQARVYVYYTYDRTDPDDRYAVGPDSLMQFVLMYGGAKIVALPGNRDDLSTGPKTVDARKLPPAPDAVREEPNVYYVAPTLPPYDVRGDAFMAGKYSMVPYLRRLPTGQLTVLYWVARNTQVDLRPELFVGPEWLSFFLEHLNQYANIAWFSYPREGMPSSYQIHSARFAYGWFKQDPERARSGLKAWKEAVKDPGWWAQVVMNYASAGVPAPTSTGPPNLTVMQGGGGGAATATSTATTTLTTASRAPVAVGGGGTALAVKAPAPVIAQAPVVVPRTGPVGLPTNPNPMPITPVSPPSPVGSAIVTSVLQGVSSQAVVNANPGARPQPNPEPEKQRTCTYATGLTPADPIPMRWFKPRHDSFYQPTLAINGGTLRRDNPNASGPDGTRVGVQNRFWPRLGKVMQLWPGFRTGAERQFRQLLADWGYAWGPTEQCDHVQDPQWCGPDEVYGGNFWPLETSTNQSAGPTQNNYQLVTFCPSPSAQPAVNWRIQDMKRAGYYGRYFTIQEILLVSNRAPGLTAAWYPPAGRPTCHDGADR